MQKSAKHHYAVIMAGGSGTRLWPVSRQAMPKQFQALTSKKTMLQETFSRVAKVVPRANILVSTTEQYRRIVLRQLPQLGPDKLIIEPLPRGTAPAIALVAHTIYSRDPQAVVATIASDHAIKNTAEFAAAVRAALAAAADNPEKLVTIGINPTFADTGLGYIKMGKEAAHYGAKKVFFIDAFKEKPDQKTAEKYLCSYAYLWNAGYFIFTARGFLKIASRLMPKTGRALSRIGKLKDKKAVAKIYAKLDNEAIDTAVAEKLPPALRLVVPSEMDWSDVGNWSTLFDFFRSGAEAAMIVKGRHIDHGSRNCLVHAQKKLIATVGLNDVIIIETDDTILVADKKKVSEVKKITEKLKAKGQHLYL